MTGESPERVPLDRILDEDWGLDPGDPEFVVEFSKPSVDYRVSPPIRPTREFLDAPQNRAYRRPKGIPDSVAELDGVSNAFELGWVISNPAEFEVHTGEDGEINESDLGSNVPIDTVEYGGGKLVRISTRWSVEVDPSRPLLVIHPVFTDHDRFTTLTQVVYPDQYPGDLQVYLDVNEVPMWVMYDDPLAQVVPLPEGVTDRFEARVTEGRNDRKRE